MSEVGFLAVRSVKLPTMEHERMANLNQVQDEILRFASASGFNVQISGIYDLLPGNSRPAHPCVVARWPDRWPNGNSQGVYLFFGADGDEPDLRYVGKSAGKTSRIRSRLNGYFDSEAKRTTGKCVFLNEWNGYIRTWEVEQRYVVTVAMEPDCDSGACQSANILEKHIIEHFLPPENTSLKPK